MNVTTANTEFDFDLAGRTVSAHIAAAKRHQDQLANHMKSGAIMLLDVKAKLPRGTFDGWLEKHGIARSTAYRWIKEYQDPQSALNRREDQRIRDADTRARSACNPVPDPKPEPKSPTRETKHCNREEHKHTEQKQQKPSRPPVRIEEKQLQKMAKDMPTEILREWLRIGEELLKETKK